MSKMRQEFAKNLDNAKGDLYEALKWARVEIFARMQEAGDSGINPILQQIDKALAKAEGN